MSCPKLMSVFFFGQFATPVFFIAWPPTHRRRRRRWLKLGTIDIIPTNSIGSIPYQKQNATKVGSIPSVQHLQAHASQLQLPRLQPTPLQHESFEDLQEPICANFFLKLTTGTMPPRIKDSVMSKP